MVREHAETRADLILIDKNTSYLLADAVRIVNSSDKPARRFMERFIRRLQRASVSAHFASDRIDTTDPHADVPRTLSFKSSYPADSIQAGLAVPILAPSNTYLPSGIPSPAYLGSDHDWMASFSDNHLRTLLLMQRTAFDTNTVHLRSCHSLGRPSASETLSRRGFAGASTCSRSGKHISSAQSAIFKIAHVTSRHCVYAGNTMPAMSRDFPRQALQKRMLEVIRGKMSFEDMFRLHSSYRPKDAATRHTSLEVYAWTKMSITRTKMPKEWASYAHGDASRREYDPANDMDRDLGQAGVRVRVEG